MSAAMANALRRAAVQPSSVGFRAVPLKRNMGSAADTGSAAGKGSWADVKNHWLGDKGAWPVMGVISGTVVFVACWSIKTLVTHPDVRIGKDVRTSVIRKAKKKQLEAES